VLPLALLIVVVDERRQALVGGSLIFSLRKV
jgi:hypothetical protein